MYFPIYIPPNPPPTTTSKHIDNISAVYFVFVIVSNICGNSFNLFYDCVYIFEQKKSEREREKKLISRIVIDKKEMFRDTTVENELLLL